jgi:RimJ/RimL family protein N-acetyltransferase
VVSSREEAAEVPTLETTRLRLRGWSARDAASYERIMGHPRVTSALGRRPEPGAAAVSRLARQWREQGFGHWAVEERASGALIGRIGLAHHPDWTPDPDNVEVGWTLDPEVWGRGLATEGGGAALADGFGRLGLERIISITLPENRASRRVMEKLGLTLRGSARWRGAEHVWYAVERSTWRDGAAATPPGPEGTRS